MIGVNTYNVRQAKNAGIDIPVPNVVLVKRSGSGVSNFSNDPVNWFHEVYVRFQTVPESFKAAEDPWLELAWCRQTRKDPLGRPNTRERNTRRWSFPDDPVLKTGGGIGNGTQNNPNGTAIRRSKWAITPVDGEFATGSRIQLEHYFRLGLVRVFSFSLNHTFIKMLRPTFLEDRRDTQPFSLSVFNPLSKVPKYHGYENAYFAFAFSVKDPNASHPGDRIVGPLSKIIKATAKTANNSFPISYGNNNQPQIVGDGNYLYFQFVRGR
jgi:hypothetical protein